MVQIIEYSAAHQPWFESLNRAWIEQYFWMEPLDVAVLKDPDKHILRAGGSILMASFDREIAGTVALKFVQDGVFEFTKMAVNERFRGNGVGKALAHAALERASALGAEKVVLYSSTKLEPALALYRKLGFVEVPVDGPYKRSDVKMEFTLKQLSKSIVIRQAVDTDIPLLRTIASRTFEETFAVHNTPEDMKSYLQQNFTIHGLTAEFKTPGSVFFLAFDHDNAVGYAKMRTGTTPTGLEAQHPVEIERIYSTKDYLGRQVGQLLLQATLDTGIQRGHDVIWLGVWENNLRAIAFYEKHGFVAFGSHPFQLGDDLQTDVLMKRALSKASPTHI